MRKQRIEAAEKVAAQLFDVEHKIDAALSSAAALAGLMPSVRRDARLSALHGQDALERSIRTVAALGEARREIVEAHKELSTTQAQVGLRTYAVGGLTEKPPMQAENEQDPVTAEATRVRA